MATTIIPISKSSDHLEIVNMPTIICPVCKKEAQVSLDHALIQINGRWLIYGKFSCCGCSAVFSVPAIGNTVDAANSDWKVETYKAFSRFPDIINTISPRFVKVYLEAEEARKLNLLEICGGGYRKALEILIVDYLIYQYPDESKRIIKLGTMGNRIKEYFEAKGDTHLMDMTNLAFMFGNDQVHYKKIFQGKTPGEELDFLEAMIESIVGCIMLYQDEQFRNKINRAGDEEDEEYPQKEEIDKAKSDD